VECDATVSALADFVGSTAAPPRFVRDDAAKAFLLAPGARIQHPMRQAKPDAELIPADSGCNCSLCP